MNSDMLWPADFVDEEMRGKTFSWTINNRSEWVDFTVTEMRNPTGLFLKWKEYCNEIIKEKENSHEPSHQHDKHD